MMRDAIIVKIITWVLGVRLFRNTDINVVLGRV